MRCVFKSSTAYATTERILNDNLHCHRSGNSNNDTHYSIPNRHSGEERTANDRPYKLWSFAELSFRQWQYTDYLRRI